MHPLKTNLDTIRYNKTILSKIIKGSANSFLLCLTLKVTLFKIQNNVGRQGPFEINSYTD